MATALQLLNFVKRIPDPKANGKGYKLAICVDWKLVESHAARVACSKTRIALDPDALRWTPLVYTFHNNDDNESGSRGGSPSSGDGDSNNGTSNNKETTTMTASPIRKTPVAAAIASTGTSGNDLVKSPDKKALKRKKKRGERVEELQIKEEVPDVPDESDNVVDSDVEIKTEIFKPKQKTSEGSRRKRKKKEKAKKQQQPKLEVEVKEETEEDLEEEQPEEEEEPDSEPEKTIKDSDSSETGSDEDGRGDQGGQARCMPPREDRPSTSSRKSKGSKDSDSKSSSKKSGSKSGRRRDMGNTIIDLKKRKMVAASMSFIANATAVAAAAKRAKKRKPTVDSSSLDEDECEGKSKNMILGKVLKARAKKVTNLEEEEKAHRHQYQQQKQLQQQQLKSPSPPPPQQPRASLTTVSGSLKIEIGDVASVVKKLKKPKLVIEHSEITPRTSAIVEPVVVQKLPSLFEKRRLSKSVEILPINPDGEPFVRAKEQVKDVTSVTAVSTPIKISSHTTATVITTPVTVTSPVLTKDRKDLVISTSITAVPVPSSDKEEKKKKEPKVDPEKQKRDREERYNRRLNKRTVDVDEFGDEIDEPTVRKKMLLSASYAVATSRNGRTSKQLSRKKSVKNSLPVQKPVVTSTTNVVSPSEQTKQSRPRKMKKIRRHKGYKYWGTPPSHAKRKKKPVAIVAPSTSSHHHHHNSHQHNHFAKQQQENNLNGRDVDMEDVVSCRTSSPPQNPLHTRRSPGRDGVPKDVPQIHSNSEGSSDVRENKMPETNGCLESTSSSPAVSTPEDPIAAPQQDDETKDDIPQPSSQESQQDEEHVQIQPAESSSNSAETPEGHMPDQPAQQPEIPQVVVNPPPNRRSNVSMSSDEKVLDLDPSGFPIVRDVNGNDDDDDGGLSEIKDYDIATSLGDHDGRVDDRLDDDDSDFENFEIRGDPERPKEPDSESLRVIPSGPSSCNTIYDDSDLASQPSVPPPGSNGNNGLFDSPVMVDSNGSVQNRSSSSCSNNTNSNCGMMGQQQMSPCVPPSTPGVPSVPPPVQTQQPPVMSNGNSRSSATLALPSQNSAPQQQQNILPNGNPQIYHQPPMPMNGGNMTGCQQQGQSMSTTRTSPMPTPATNSSCQMMQQQEMHNMGYSSGMTPQHQHSSYNSVHSNQSCPPGSVEAMDPQSQMNMESPHSSIGSVETHYPHGGPASVDSSYQNRQSMYDSCAGSNKYNMQHSPMVMVNPPTPQQPGSNNSQQSMHSINQPPTPQQQQMNHYNSAPPTPQSGINMHHPSPPSQNQSLNNMPHHNSLPQPSPPTPQSYHHHSPPTPQPVVPPPHPHSVPSKTVPPKALQHQQPTIPLPMSPGCHRNSASSPQNLSHYCPPQHSQGQQSNSHSQLSPGTNVHSPMSPLPPHMQQQSHVSPGANSPQNMAQYHAQQQKHHSNMTQQQQMMYHQQMMTQQQQRQPSRAHHAPSTAQSVIQQRAMTPAPPMSPAPASHATHPHSNSNC